MSKPGPAAKPKGTFAPSSFAKLRSFAGEGNGEPLRISLADIDEDPNQPRKAIGAEDLEPLAATIRSHGVLQPIGLHPPIDGRYQLAFGARRLRASHIAGKLDIQAIIVPDAQRNYASQVIENQQRADLNNTDLAAAVLHLYENGSSIEEIALISNLKEYAVAAYRAVPKFPEFLTNRLNTGDMRALYDLYRQWTKTPAEIEAAMPGENYVTITDARRIISSINGKPTGSIVIAQPSRDDSETDSRDRKDVLSEDRASQVASPGSNISVVEPTSTDAPVVPGSPALKPNPVVVNRKRDPVGAAIIIVAIGDGETGELVTETRAETAGWGLVRYPTGIEEVELRQLRIVAIE